MTYALVSALCMAVLILGAALINQPDAVAQEHARALNAEATVTAVATYMPKPTPIRFNCGSYYNC